MPDERGLESGTSTLINRMEASICIAELMMVLMLMHTSVIRFDCASTESTWYTRLNHSECVCRLIPCAVSKVVSVGVSAAVSVSVSVSVRSVSGRVRVRSTGCSEREPTRTSPYKPNRERAYAAKRDARKTGPSKSVSSLHPHGATHSYSLQPATTALILC